MDHHQAHHQPMQQAMTAPAPAAGMTDSSAANLRVDLNHLLGEHVYLAARATGAALGGQQAGFEAAAASLDMNSVDLSRAIGAVYGPDAEAAFLPLWRAHIGMVVEYTQGLATDDTAKQTKAVNDLVGYTEDFGAFLSAANPNLPRDTVASLVKDHVLSLKAVIDAQKARDQAGVYNGLREAIGHMGHIADPLAGAIAKQFPDRFPGEAMTPGVDYRIAVNNLLAEHVYLAASAAVGGLAGNPAQFQAAAAALDGNSVDLSKGIGMAYGPQAEAAFLAQWRAHIGMLVDYVGGKASADQGKQDKAVSDLIGYTQDFAAFLSSANENLPKDVLVDLLASHVLTLKDVVDTQAAGNPTAHFAAVRTAGGHMSHIANPLAEATVAKFPEKFGGMMSSMPGMMEPVMAPSAARTTATIRQFAFQPSNIEVGVGSTVSWTNDDATQHSVTSASGSFDSGLFGQGGEFSHTFDTVGTYEYFCMRHPSMRGSVTVS
jgi:plastocyanin